MRLLDVNTERFEEFQEDLPQYAVASHRWSRDGEISYEEMLEYIRGRVKSSRSSDSQTAVNIQTSGEDWFQSRGKASAYAKLRGFCRVAASMEFDWVWIDTVCINKANLTELSEAINSMFRWYKEAAVCLAYLRDVPSLEHTRPRSLVKRFEISEWFKRGWTLQELLAPAVVVFYTQAWEPIGVKGGTRKVSTKVSALSVADVGSPVNCHIAAWTGIPEDVLDDVENAENYSLKRRQSWIRGRTTTKPEDLAYCQFGLFGVHLPLIYGEREGAHERLQEAIEKRERSRLRMLGRLKVVSSHST